MKNDEKERHVLAAAVHCGAETIVTFNLRHFRAEHLSPWGVRAVHPQVFLVELLRVEPDTVRLKLQQQARDRNRPLRDLLRLLERAAPEFAAAATLEFAKAGTPP
jgi:hypothetical protein